MMITSGAIQNGVAQCVVTLQWQNSPNLDNPKSAILQCPSLPTSTFSSFRSLKIKKMYVMFVTTALLWVS